MALMMRSMIEVADNSGARKLQMIMPLGGSTGLHARLGDVITASVKEAAPDGQVQKGKVVKGSDRADAQRISAAGWNLYPLRSECGGADQRDRRTGRDARVRPGGARTAREEVFKDCVAGAGSFIGSRQGLSSEEKQVRRLAQDDKKTFGRV